MCDLACIDYGIKVISKSEIEGKRVIEIGSCNVNGSLKDILVSYSPSEYIGLDMQSGPYVDVVCKVEDVLGIYGENSFDAVICTEMMEHVFDWRKAINNMKLLCRYGGIIFITTRSWGFPHHGWPHDHWRFEAYDFNYIFSDFKQHGSVITYADTATKGAYVKVVKPIKPIDYRILDITDYKVYNIIYDMRI